MTASEPTPDLTLADPTLDEARAALASVIPHHAAFDGWGDAALEAAAFEIGLDPAVARLAFPDGVVGMIDAWFSDIDRRMAAALPPERLAAMKIRQRITALVATRLEIAAPDREALRRAVALLALPTNAAAGLRLGWRAADEMWHLAGDRATDFAYYTKRTTLAAVYASTALVFLDDESEDMAETRAFLDRRIADVMRIEGLKARLKPDPERMFSPARFLGRLRYRTV
ncbi:MAG: COQ9 family protein [Sphingomonas sp.]